MKSIANESRTRNRFIESEVPYQFGHSDIYLVGNIGFEPMTFSVSEKNSTTELIAYVYCVDF